MRQLSFRRVNAIFGVALLLWPIGLIAQELPPAEQEVPAEQQAPALAPDQLDDLVAPIALYPDELLGEVLAASTYPLEIVEAQQWLLENRGLIGTQLIDAARQRNWDPSVQALVAFPSALRLLSQNVRWTTDLGNAFLAQQADVMDAVQRLRARARDNGRLVSTPQQTVTMDQMGQVGQAPGAIEIQPANPQVVYVPYYNPAYVWGAPAYGAYPVLGYPDTGSGIGFNLPALLGTLFSGLMSFGGWGWGLNWLSHLLFLNNLFFGHFGFGGGFGGGGFGGGATAAWVHNPGHRLGVAYPNRFVASRYAGARPAGFATARSYNAPARANNTRSYESRSYSSPRSYSGGSYNARASASPSYSHSYDYNRSYNSGSYSSGYSRSYNSGSAYNRPSYNYSRSYASPTREMSRSSAPARNYASNSFRESPHYSAPKAEHYSAPKAPHYSAPKMSHMKAPKAPKMSSHGGGHSGGHSSGKHR